MVLGLPWEKHKMSRRMKNTVTGMREVTGAPEEPRRPQLECVTGKGSDTALESNPEYETGVQTSTRTQAVEVKRDRRLVTTFTER